MKQLSTDPLPGLPPEAAVQLLAVFEQAAASRRPRFQFAHSRKEADEMIYANAGSRRLFVVHWWGPGEREAYAR